VHPMASVLPAALAAAESRGGVSGAELIVAGSHRRRGISLPVLGLPHEQGFAFSALQSLVVLVPSQPPGVCLVLTTGRWRQLSPGNSLRSAAPCRRMPREVRCYRFRLRLTLGLHCNPAS
jgi:hypothetical protein